MRVNFSKDSFNKAASFHSKQTGAAATTTPSNLLLAVKSQLAQDKNVKEDLPQDFVDEVVLLQKIQHELREEIVIMRELMVHN